MFNNETCNKLVNVGTGLAILAAPIALAYLDDAKSNAEAAKASSNAWIEVGSKALLMRGVTAQISGDLMVRITPELLGFSDVSNLLWNTPKIAVRAFVENPLFFSSNNPDNSHGVVGWLGYNAASAERSVYIGYSEAQKPKIRLIGPNGELLNPANRSPRADIQELQQLGLLTPVTITGVSPDSFEYSIKANDVQGQPVNLLIAKGTNPEK